MRRYVKKTESVTKDVLAEMTCDLCGSEARNGTWEKDCYDVNEVTIEHETGYRVPDSASITRLSVDICPECFIGKLIPWLESQGVEVQKTKIEL